MTIRDRLVDIFSWSYAFLLPWQTQWVIRPGVLNGGVWEYGRISLYATDLIAVLLLLSAFLKTRPRRFSIVEIIVVSLLVLAGFSSFLGPDQILGWYSFLRLGLGVAVFFVLVRSRSVSLSFIGTAFVAGSVIQAGLAIGEFFTQSTPVSTALGLPLHDSAVSGTAVVETGAGRLLRPSAGLPHPNVLGGYLAVALILLSGFYVKLYDTIRGWFNRHPHHGHRMLNEQDRRDIAWTFFRLTLILAATVVVTFGLFFSLSRSAWLGALGGFTAIFIVTLLRRQRYRAWLVLKFLVFVALAVVFASPFAPGAFTSRVSATDRLETKSTVERRQGIDDAFSLLKTKWHTGVGIGRYTLVVHGELDSRRDSYAYQPVHNLYLLLAVELSVFGLFVFLALLIETVNRYFIWLTSPHHYYDVWVDVLAGAAFCLLLIGFFDHYLWTLSAGIGIFWLTFGLFWSRLLTTSHPHAVDKPNP